MSPSWSRFNHPSRLQRSLLITVICPAACRCSSASWQCRDRPFAEMGSPSPSTTSRRVKRTRRPRPAAAGLAGLPHHRRGRNLPHELAVGGLVRRTIFRSAADERDHRNGGASLDRQGGMTLPQNRMSSVIPLFGQSTDHSSVGQDSHGWRAQRPSRAAAPGPRASASPLTAASTMAALRSLGTILFIVAILAASILSSGAAHAEQESSATRRPNALSVRPFTAFVTEASKSPASRARAGCGGKRRFRGRGP